jgi:hypothetical protein
VCKTIKRHCDWRRRGCCSVWVRFPSSSLPLPPGCALCAAKELVHRAGRLCIGLTYRHTQATCMLPLSVSVRVCACVSVCVHGGPTRARAVCFLLHDCCSLSCATGCHGGARIYSPSPSPLPTRLASSTLVGLRCPDSYSLFDRALASPHAATHARHSNGPSSDLGCAVVCCRPPLRCYCMSATGFRWDRASLGLSREGGGIALPFLPAGEPARADAGPVPPVAQF